MEGNVKFWLQFDLLIVLFCGKIVKIDQEIMVRLFTQSVKKHGMEYLFFSSVWEV